MRARKRCQHGVLSTDSQPSSSTAQCQQLQQPQHRLFHRLHYCNRDTGSASSAAAKQLKACISRYFTSKLFLLPSILLMALTSGSPTVNGALFLAAKRSSGGLQNGLSVITIGAMDESLRLSVNNHVEPLLIPTTEPPLPFFLRPSIQHQFRYQLSQADRKKNPSSFSSDGLLLVEVDTRPSALRPLNNNRTSVDNEEVPLKIRNTISTGSYFANDNDAVTGSNHVVEFKTDNNIYVPSSSPSLNTLFDVKQQRKQRLLHRSSAPNRLDTMQLLLSAPNKRSMRRCGKVLVKHIQNVCNGCLRGPETEPLFMRERRSGVAVDGIWSDYFFHRLAKRDGTAINKITEMCCTERTCTDDEIRPYCC